VKIYLHYQTLKTAWGGSNSFLSTLAETWAKHKDITLVNTIHEDYDVLLLSSWSTGLRPTSVFDIRHIRRYGYASLFHYLKNRGRYRRPLLVHRLDGIGYLYGRQDRRDDQRQVRLNHLAHASIVQSQFSQTLFAQEGIDIVRPRIILNGVNQSIFSPANGSGWNGQAPLRLAAVSWSANPRKGHATIAAFSCVPNVHVHFLGNWPASIPRHNVIAHPAVPFHNVADFYRSCDALLFPAEQESCPNVVLEAISCGLPVLYHPSGGTPELAAHFGLPLMQDQTPAQTIDQLKELYPELRRRCRQEAKSFDIQNTAEQYLSYFKELRDLPKMSDPII